MKIPRLKTGFDGLSDPDFETKATSIYSGMERNSNFTTPIPEMPIVESALKRYSESLTNAQTKDKNAVAIKKQAKDSLIGLLIQLANYVMTTANGDLIKLISSNFDVAKEGETTPLTKPTGITLGDGINSGELLIKIRALKGANSYLPQYTSEPLTADSKWIPFAVTTCKYTFKNLEAGKKYWCRVAAIGSYGQIVYSDAVCRIVQ